MKKEKIKLTRNELYEHFNEQLEFLKNSCNSYDNGFIGESKRIAITLRILLHDNKFSHSLLGQLGEKNIKFLSSALLVEKESLFPHNGLVMIGVKGKETKYLAMLDDTPDKNWLTFDNWWCEPIIIDNQKQIITRENLVRIASDQDGGAHIDPELDKTYSRLSKGISLGVTYQVGDETILLKKPELAAIRQIGHEVLKSLVPNYSKEQTANVDMFLGGVATNASSHQTYKRHERKIGRNELCYCGSGIKYKKCHGKTR